MACVAICATLVAAAQVTSSPRTEPPLFSKSFELSEPAEVVAVIHAGCARCCWGDPGREAAGLSLTVDGRYSQHVMLARGEPVTDYRAMLGALSSGRHELHLFLDTAVTAPGVGMTTIETVDIVPITATMTEYAALSMSPILHARPNTVGRFTDLPSLMWYEMVATPRGRKFRYSVIFTNEDGGTPTDRLMATWGRTTDIEFVYGVEVDEAGHVLAEEFQGPGHELTRFAGNHDARHPLLWVATDNNMVSDAGTTTMRYGLPPERFELREASRESVMDAHPWIYQLMAQEIAREGKIADDAPAGSGKIPDPRRFVYMEACTQLQNAGLSFGVHAQDSRANVRWFDSDRGLPDFRIVRSGCFRGAVPVGMKVDRIDGLRFRAFTRSSPERSAGRSADPAMVQVVRVNKVFTLGDDFFPRPSMFGWEGSLALSIDGPPVELQFNHR
jgi:hypothetical protein